MSTKNFTILLLLCLGVGALALFSPVDDTGVGFVIEDQKPWEKLPVNEVDKITLIQNEETLTLQRTSDFGEWRGERGELNYPVSIAKLKDFLLSVRDINLTARKALSRKFDENYGLNDDANPVAYSIFADGKELASFTLGKVERKDIRGMRPGMGPELGQYIRVSGKDEVFLSNETVDASFDDSFWMQKTVADADREDITKITFKQPYKTFSLIREDIEVKTSTEPDAPTQTRIEWKSEGELPKDASVDRAEIDRLLDRLIEVNANSPAPKSTMAMVKGLPEYSVKVFAKTRTIYELQFRNLDGIWYVWRSDKGETFEIGEWRAEQILGVIKNVFKPKAWTMDKNTIQSIAFKNGELAGLSIHRDAGQWMLDGTLPALQINKNIIDSLLLELERMDFEDWYNTTTVADHQRMEVKTTDGKTVVLQFGDKMPLNDSVITLISDKGGTWGVSEGSVGNLFPSREKLVNPNSVPQDLSKVSEIRFKDFSLKLKGQEWEVTQDNKSALVPTSAVEPWFNNYQSVFESKYIPVAEEFEAKDSITIVDSSGGTTQLLLSDGDRGRAKASVSAYGGSFDIDWNIVKSLVVPPEFFSDNFKTE